MSVDLRRAECLTNREDTHHGVPLHGLVLCVTILL
jgi:hypothetical protein